MFSEVEILSEVVDSMTVGEVCGCEKVYGVPEPEGIPEVAVKLTVVSEMAAVVLLLS